MFRYISKRALNILNPSKNNCNNENLTINLLSHNQIYTANNQFSKSFHSLVTPNQPAFAALNPIYCKLTKTQSFNFSFGKHNLYRFNKEINSRYGLKDFTKIHKNKEWLEKKKQTFRANLKISKLSTTLAQPRDSRKLELNPIFSPNKRKLNKLIRKNVMKNIESAEAEDSQKLEDRLFLKDLNAQSLENLRKIKENKIFNKKLHELHERKLAVKLEGKKLENLIENFDFKFKNFEIYNDTEANSVKTYMLTDFVPAGRLNYGENLNEKNPLKNKRYEAPYKVQTRFNEFIEHKNHLKNLRIESLLVNRKSNPTLNKYLYSGENGDQKLLLGDKASEAVFEGVKQLETSKDSIEDDGFRSVKGKDTPNDSIGKEFGSLESANKQMQERDLSTMNVNENGEFKSEPRISLKNINMKSASIYNENKVSTFNGNEIIENNRSENYRNSSSNNDIEIINNPEPSIEISINNPITQEVKTNFNDNSNTNDSNYSIENYFKKHIDLKSRINNYETELYNEYRDLDIYNKYQKGIVKFSELSLAENLNYVKFNLKNTQDLFQMYSELKHSDNPLVFGSMVQKLSTCLKNEKDVSRTLNLYEYKDLLRDFKKNFRMIDNKNFVDSLWAIGKLHRNGREFSPKFFQHLLSEMLDEAAERAETLRIEEIAFLCQGLVYLNVSEKTDDLMVVAKKNLVLERIYNFLVNGEPNKTANESMIANSPSALPSNSPITKLKYLHHASSIIICFNNQGAGLSNKNYVDLLNYFSVPLKQIIAERSLELIDEVDLKDFKNLISCYANGVSKLRFLVENQKDEDLKTPVDKEALKKLEISKEDLFDNLEIYRNNYNRSNLLKRLDRHFDTFMNEKQFLKDEELEIKSRVLRKYDQIQEDTKKEKNKNSSKNNFEENISEQTDKDNKQKEAEEADLNLNFNEKQNEEKINKENLERNIQVINAQCEDKDIKLLENPKKNFLEVMDFLTSVTLYKENKMEIKDTSEIMFSVANAKLFDYKFFLNKLRKKTLDELDKGRPFTLKQITKYFWGLSQLNTKFFVPQFNLDFNSLVFPRLLRKMKSGSFVEINKVKKVIFEMKNVVDNKELSLLLYALANMGYADPEFFVPILHNLIQYDKMAYLNSISAINSSESSNKNNFNRNKINKEFYFAFKDVAYYLNALAFLNYNDEVLVKFFLNKLQNILAPAENKQSESYKNNINNNLDSDSNAFKNAKVLAVNGNNDLAISMLFASLVHLNLKRNMRNLKNWQLLLNNLINYCSVNYTEKNAKNLTSIIWFMVYFDYQNYENYFNKFMSLISLEFNKLSKFDKVVLNQSLILLHIRHKMTYKSELFGVQQIRELNACALDFEKSRRIIQKKYAETHFENEANSDLVKKTLEKYSEYLLKKGFSLQKDYVIENSYIADAFIKQKNLIIEVYDYYEVLKDKELNGYNLLKQEIYEELGFNVLKIYANEFEFLIAKEDEEKLFDYLIEKIDKY